MRLFVLDDLLARIRKLITTYYEDPNYVARIRLLLNQGELDEWPIVWDTVLCHIALEFPTGSRDRILLEEVLAYLIESLDEIRLPPPADESIGRRLQKVFKCMPPLPCFLLSMLTHAVFVLSACRCWMSMP